MAKGRYLEAIPLMRHVAVGEQGTTVDAARGLAAWQLLAQAYGAIGQWDQAATAYEQAAALAPTVGWLSLGAAQAWTAAGRLDAAEARYEQALSLGAPAEVRVALAGVRLRRQLRLPKTARDWAPFCEALAQAKTAQTKKPPAEPWRLTLIEAEYLVARGAEQNKTAEAIRQAVELCHTAERENPAAPNLLSALVPAYQRLEQPADADRVLMKLKEIKGQEGTACLSQARLEAGRKHYESARKLLAAGLETLPKEVQPVLRRELADLDLLEGRSTEAREELLKLHEAEPENRECVFRLIELAFDSGNLPEVEQREAELRKLEGPDGLFCRVYRARRLLTELTGPNDPRYAEAAELQAYIQNLRPFWPKTYLIQGLLSEAAGKLDQAAEAYEEAIKLGERLPVAYQRLISLLLVTGRAEEADHYLALMEDQIVPAESLASLEMVVAAKRGQIERTLDAARRGVQQRPKDPMAHVWLGQVLQAAGKTEEAEASFRAAVALAPDDVPHHRRAVRLLCRRTAARAARETLQAIGKNEKLNKGQRASLLAMGYDLLGDRQEAEAGYREAARLAPDDAASQMRLAQYLVLRGRRPTATGSGATGPQCAPTPAGFEFRSADAR